MDPDDIKVELFCGQPWGRYVIKWAGPDLYWHGEGWTADRRKALLYAHLRLAKADWETVVKQQRGGAFMTNADQCITALIIQDQLAKGRFWIFRFYQAHIATCPECTALLERFVEDAKVTQAGGGRCLVTPTLQGICERGDKASGDALIPHIKTCAECQAEAARLGELYEKPKGPVREFLENLMIGAALWIGYGIVRGTSNSMAEINRRSGGGQAPPLFVDPFFPKPPTEK